MLMLSFLIISGAYADDLPRGPRTSAKYPATEPTSWSRFCSKYKGECDTPANDTYLVKLDDATLAVIQRINKRVNSEISYVTDQEHWKQEDQYDLPADGRGDCEDIALQKRHLLIKAGFPARALLLTVVLWRDSGHAILTVVTDRGDLILDNYTDRIKTFEDHAFTLVQRQDPNWLARWKRFEEWQP